TTAVLPMNSRPGHWFCTKCDDVVFLHSSTASPAACPQCHHLTAEFILNPVPVKPRTISDRPVSRADSPLLFQKLRDSIL
ncbi:MAG: hypothetical protein ACTHLW_18225, partial [Verrucomicrobiota bacterium]